MMTKIDDTKPLEVRKVMVTGGCGFIGREFAKKLLRKGYAVVAFDLRQQYEQNAAVLDAAAKLGDLEIVDGTILDRLQLQRAMQGCDAVVHLAAMLGVKRTEENRLACLEINATGTDCVLSTAAMNGVRRVIVASSSEVYGEPIKNPIKEGDITQGKTVYAVSKLAAEELTKGYAQLFPWMKYTIVRFFNTYGEGQVAQFVISRFVRAVLEGKNPVVYGDGTQKRGYGHVDDVTEAMAEILVNPIAFNKTYNLGNSREVYTLSELAQKVIDVLAPGKGLKVEVLGGFDGSDRTAEREIFVRHCDTSLAKADFGFDPKITVEEGIRRIAAGGPIAEDWPDAVNA